MLTSGNIFKHCLQLIYYIVSAFNLQFLYHLLLCFIRYACLIEQSLCQELCEPSNEYVAICDTTEKSYQILNSCFHITICNRFKPHFHLVIDVKSDLVWGPGLLTHEFLEGQISNFLEFHVVVEGQFDQGVYFSLKFK
jgi:hypothetical protein